MIRWAAGGAFALLLAMACGGAPAPGPEALPVPPPTPTGPPARSGLLVPPGTARWSVAQRTGAGPRFLGMTQSPPQSGQVATWSLERRGGEARFRVEPAAGEPTEVVYAVEDRADATWILSPGDPRPLFEVARPPGALSSELVACVAHALGGLAGVCPALPGGPLAQPAALLQASTQSAEADAKTLAQLGIGLLTVGVFVPGNTSTRETVRLLEGTGAPGAPPEAPWLAEWRRKGDLSAVERHLGRPIQAEEAGALLATAPEPVALDLAVRLVANRPYTEQIPLLRVAAQRELDLLKLTARLAAEPAPEAWRASLLERVEESQRAALEALLEGRWPTLRAVLVAPPERQVATLAAAPPLTQTEEWDALLKVVEDPEAALGAVWPKADPQARGWLVAAVLGQLSFDEERLALLKRRDLLPAAAVQPEWMPAWLRAFSFDPGRRDLVLAVVAVASPAIGRALLVEGVVAMDFDDARLELLRQRPDLVAGLDGAERSRLLGAFVFEREAAEAVLRGGK